MSTTPSTRVSSCHDGRLDQRRSASPSAVALLILTVSLGAHVHRPASLAAQQKAESPRWSAPPLKFASSLRVGTAGVTKDGSGRPTDVGTRISLERGLDALAKDDSGRPVQIVFLGETHTDETTHRFELAAFEGLCERSGNRVVLSLEMFDRDVQPVLDDYLAGKIDEAAFLEQSRPWNNYRSAYRPLVEAAKRRGLPVIAANFPRGLRRQVMMRGKEGWESIQNTSPLLVPKKLLPHSRFYWKRVDNAIRGHLAMMQLPDDPAERLLSTQSLWDNTMAESCLDALEKHPGWTVLHVNGGFHSAYHDGTVRQVKLRSPATVVRTVA
ncbi:MAG TPA: hypothetical protein ENJ50_06715, partial [Planctomycetaceae bacterium]|nr:hypothetical protein [Planctomycetaceae bacterium]